MPWTAVLPLASWTAAKSRLRAASSSPAAHRRLVAALRADSAAALRDSAVVVRVVGVSPDPRCLDWAAGQGFIALAEEVPGLNGALRQAAALAAHRWPADGVLAVVGDLPAATGAALDDVLGQVGPADRGFVADRAGTGTTILVAAPGVGLEPRFGPGSASRHAASGARPLAAAAELRCDVDTPADLRHVLRLAKLGGHTRAAAVDAAQPAVGRDAG
jgi:2-phospho-L-lactate/phosphoenolpyruvate guanylyltransferase